MDFTNILELVKVMVANINTLQSQLQDAQAQIEAVATESYNKGLADGKASMVTDAVTDKLYSQAELDAAVVSAVAPLKEKVAALEVEVAAVKVELEVAKASVVDVDAVVAEAVKAVKLEIAAKIEDAQIDDLKLAEELKA